MKEHLQAQLTNDLVKIANQYHGYGCLRELIGARIAKALTDDEQGHSPECDLRFDISKGCSCGWWRENGKPVRFKGVPL